jgi:hypothetical protein
VTLALALALRSAMTDFGQDNTNLSLDSNRVPPQQAFRIAATREVCCTRSVGCSGVRIVTRSATATLIVHFRIVSYKLICSLTTFVDSTSRSITKM